MKSLLACLSMCALALTAQTRAATVLTGSVRINEVAGPALANVRISAEGANPVVTDSTGQFRLAFPQRQPGDSVDIRVTRQGWAVVNDLQLGVTLPRDAAAKSLTILMSKGAERRWYAERFYGVQLGRVATSITDEHKPSSSDEERQRLTRERDAAVDQAHQLAQQLALNPRGATDGNLRHAQRLVLEGRVDEALALLSPASVKMKEQELADEHILRAQLLAMTRQIEDADRAFREALKIAPENRDANAAYAQFNLSLHRFEPALAAYQSTERIDRDGFKHDPESFAPRLAQTLNGLGVLYLWQNRAEEATRALGEAVSIQNELSSPDLSTSLQNLGVLLSRQHRYPDARKALAQALALRRTAAKLSPEVFKPAVAMTLINLGALDYDRNERERAITELLEAVSIYKGLIDTGLDYRFELANVLGNLANAQDDTNRLADARANYARSTSLFRELSKASPEEYSGGLAQALSNSGMMEMEQKNYEAAATAYSEAEVIARELYRKDAEQHGPGLAAILSNIGRLRRQQQRYDDARGAYQEALALYTEAARQNPERFRSYVAETRAALTGLPPATQ